MINWKWWNRLNTWNSYHQLVNLKDVALKKKKKKSDERKKNQQALIGKLASKEIL